MTTIVQAATAEELDDVRRLMRAFASWRRERHDDITAADEGFVDRELEGEATEMPGAYAPPYGRLLIAYESDQPAGCAALRGLGEGVCEASAIFVTGRFRGQHVGRALVERLLLEARGAGYRRMCLGTNPHEDEAMRLCERTGFQRTSLGHGVSDQTPSSRVFFERNLRVAS